MSITIFKKNLADSLFGAPVELRAFEGWVQWRAADSADAWQNLFEIPADGEQGMQGPIGLPGTNGASVELRELDGWVQWRQSDDDPSWTNLYEIPAGGGGGEPATIDYLQIEAAEYLQKVTLSSSAEFLIDLSAHQGYDRIEIQTKLRSTANAAEDLAQIVVNGDGSAANYHWQIIEGANAVSSGSETAGSLIFDRIPATTSTPEAWSFDKVVLNDYAGGSRKNILIQENDEVTNQHQRVGLRVGVWKSTAPITSITIRTDNSPTDLFAAGSSVTVIGYRSRQIVADLDGGGMFKGDPGADGADGADGRDVEMQTVLSEDGRCQTLQWRLIGDSEWLDLATTPVCEADPTPGLSNSAQNRCGVAVAVTAALGTYYRRVKLDPDVWDDLQTKAGQVQSVGQTVAIASGVLTAVIGTGGVAGFVGMVGGAMLSVGGFLGGILSLTNDNLDALSPAVTDYLSASLYCVLTRQETTQISAAVLREWVSYIADAAVPSADLDIILGLLLLVPISYWQNEATVAQPKINPCSTATCPNRDMLFSYEFNALPVPDAIPLHKPLAASMMQILTGAREEYMIVATPAPLNTRSFNVTVHLGRFVPITGIEIEALYNQTANVTSPVLTLSATNIIEAASVTGIDQSTAIIRWGGLESIDRFTISGIVGTGGDFDELAYLELYRVKICGYGWPSFGQNAVTAEPCDYDPCIDGPDYGYDQCKAFPFAEASTCWGGASWVAGEGLTPTLSVQDPTLKWVEGGIALGTGHLGGQMTIRRVEIDATYEPASGSNAGDPYLRFVANGLAQVYPINEIPPVSGRHTYIWTGSVSAPNVNLAYRLWKNSSYPSQQPDDMGGLMRIHRLTIWYDGAERTWNC